jgi:hypothetical protein
VCGIAVYAAIAHVLRLWEEKRLKAEIADIALERYHGKYGAYPPTLDPLAPEFVKAVPLDFMDGQPLCYRPTNNGHFLLYSVGLDCVDDNGKPPTPDGPRFFNNKNGNLVIATNVDVVWPVPAAP